MENLKRLSFENVDCYIFIKEEIRKYFCGFSSSFGYLIATKNKVIFITDSRYQLASKTYFEKTNVIVEISKNLGEVLSKHKGLFFSKVDSVFGFEGEISHNECEELKRVLNSVSACTLQSVSGELSRLRAVKSDEEIKKIAKAMEISGIAYNEFLKTVKIGQTERELRANLNHQLFLQGGDALSFDSIVASGENGAKPHAVPGDRKIQSGDFVTCDFGCVFDGYHADITRTFGVGNISQKQRDCYMAVKEVQEKSLRAVQPGKKCAELHNRAVEMFEKFGLASYFSHGLGHGVGVEIHEAPTLNAGSQEVLEIGNVITIEPGVYLEGEFGIRIEDTVVVSENGHINLNILPKELIII